MFFSRPNRKLNLIFPENKSRGNLNKKEAKRPTFFTDWLAEGGRKEGEREGGREFSRKQGGLTSVYKTEIVQNLVHNEPQCLYTYVSAGVL